MMTVVSTIAQQVLRKGRFYLLVLLVPACGVSMICSSVRADAPDSGGPLSDLPSVAEFQDAERVVGDYVRKLSAAKESHACVVGIETQGEKSAWVILQDAHRMVLWEPGETDLSRSRRQLDLKKDVVVDDAALNGSTYQVTQAYLDKIRSDCERNGKKFVVSVKHK